ncbi:MAG TPA: Uma2 family endonuclease [Thermoanaerobaculia bacterium]
MAEPAWKTLHGESGEPDEDESGTVLLQRVVERPDGRLELLERPPTLEDYLDPQLEDKLFQGKIHALVRRTLADILYRYFRLDAEMLVLEDCKVLLGPGLPGPGPDVSLIRGARYPDADFESYDVVEQGALPCLLIEVVSPKDRRIREMDEVDKKALYEQAGILEYLLVDPPRRATGRRFRVRGYRLGPGRRYQPIEPGDDGRLLSGTTGLRFGVTPDGQWIEVFVGATGERLLTSWEAEDKAAREEEARKAAEEKASHEEEARKAAEEEIARLRAEIERLKQPPK